MGGWIDRETDRQRQGERNTIGECRRKLPAPNFFLAGHRITRSSWMFGNVVRKIFSSHGRPCRLGKILSIAPYKEDIPDINFDAPMMIG